MSAPYRSSVLRGAAVFLSHAVGVPVGSISSICTSGHHVIIIELCHRSERPVFREHCQLLRQIDLADLPLRQAGVRNRVRCRLRYQRDYPGELPSLTGLPNSANRAESWESVSPAITHSQSCSSETTVPLLRFRTLRCACWFVRLVMTKARTARASRNGTASIALAPRERPASTHSPRTGQTRKQQIGSSSR